MGKSVLNTGITQAKQVKFRITSEVDGKIVSHESIRISNSTELARFFEFLDGGDAANWAKDCLDDAIQGVLDNHGTRWTDDDGEAPK